MSSGRLTKIFHASDPKKIKHCINYDLGYFGVPKATITFFIDTCPLVSIYFKLARNVAQTASAVAAEIITDKQTSQLLSSSTTDSSGHDPSTANAIEYAKFYGINLPRTVDGYMIQLTSINDNSPSIENYLVAFDSYIRHKGDVPSKAEQYDMMRSKYNVLLAVNGQDIGEEH
jgi:hypothetical protein